MTLHWARIGLNTMIPVLTISTPVTRKPKTEPHPSPNPRSLVKMLSNEKQLAVIYPYLSLSMLMFTEASVF